MTSQASGRVADGRGPWSRPGHEQGRVRTAYARWVVRLRHVLVLLWLGLAAASLLALPGLGAGSGGDLEGFATADEPAIAAELRSFELFGLPLLSRTAIVQHDPGGLSAYAQAEAVLRGVGITQGSYDTPLLGALPVTNTFGLFPGSREEGTTALTYVFSEPWRGFADQQRAAQQFAAEHLADPDDAYVGVTGSVPARAEQARLLQENLYLVEVVTVAAIALIVGLTFRSVVAPLLALGTAGIAAVVTVGVVGQIAEVLGVGVPAELQPLIVALLLGVVTDYAIFFLAGLRRHVAAGVSRQEAARAATAEFAPIVTVAGITVAGGTAALVVAESGLFRAFGPGMALTVLVGLTVAVTLVPALMALVGGWAFWPVRPRPADGVVMPPVDDPLEPAPEPAPEPGRWLRLLTSKPPAAVIVVLSVAGLLLAALPVRSLDLGLSFVGSLPADNEVSVAARAAEAGFAPGILSPTELLVEQPAVAGQLPQLSALGTLLERQPGVAAVLGPGDLPGAGELGVLVARSGDAARYLVIFDSAPLGAVAIDNLGDLRARLPDLLAAAGLPEARVSVAGDTALSLSVVSRTTADLLRISVAALLINFVLLVAFLRALVAPLFLLASSVLALGASLGLTALVFQDRLGQDGLTFYVPFAAAVLLVALGSDYNIFAVGHVWDLARRRPLPEAIRLATPRSTRAILAAGLALAASFGLLALVPLRPFRELAFALSVGILLDVLVVRSLLVPALLTLVGRASGWPWAGLRRTPVETHGRETQPARSVGHREVGVPRAGPAE